ncbi:MAG: DUF4349 domain-containing protein [Chloroflexi bacterium]|nr:DUF4349 domain-containing protein [Chloroflexota bacterium]MCI0813636.1 DUF4349 domain-containing protein [Chloroflexota bacterium]
MRKRILPLAGLLALVLAVGLLVSQLSDGTSADPTDGTTLGFLGVNDGGDIEQSPPEFRALDAKGEDGYESGPQTGGGSVTTNSYGFDSADAGLAGGSAGSVGGGPDSAGAGAQTLVIDRKIIRTATIELTVDDVPGAVQRIETATAAAGGFVASSSITIEQQPPPDDPEEEQEIRQRGTITIRVPAESYASVMSTLRGIVDDPRDITSLTEDTSEVTEEYSDLQARLRNLEATEVQYLELLARAESINDVLLVQDRLNSVRLEIEQVQGRIQLLDDLTSMATITTFLSLPPIVVLPVEPEPELSWAAEAWENAWNASEDALETLGVAAITGGVVLVWLLIPGALVLGGWWVVTSRRRTGDTAA